MFNQSTNEVLLRQGAGAINAGRLTEAEALCRQVLADRPRDPEAHRLLGEVERRRWNLAEASRHLERSLRLRPGHAATLTTLAEVRLEQGRPTDAMTCFDRALRASPGDARAVSGKAGLLIARGEYDRADAVLRRAIECPVTAHPELIVLSATVAMQKGATDQAIPLLEGVLTRHDLTALDRYRLGCLLGKALERCGMVDRAFEAYRAANDVITTDFDTDRHHEMTTRIIETFSAEAMRRLPRAEQRSRLPVFIVGMPRCGSSLVEQILAAHPSVVGGGEMVQMFRLSTRIPDEITSERAWPECARDLARHDVERLSRDYFASISPIAGRAERLVDKNLLNHRHLGLIALLCPEATVIHLARDPMDTCFSCYAEMLDPVDHSYATDLADLGAAYRQYERLMSHWERVLSGFNLIKVAYESLIANPQEEIARILDACGLAWDEACLRFHQTTRMVRTLSHDQVRQPIFHRSRRRAARFDQHLDPLRRSLDRSVRGESGGVG